MKDALTKILAVVGTGLVCLPILAPFWLLAGALVSKEVFRFDYLRPATLFPLALVGGGLLAWAALRARAHRGLVDGGLVILAIAWILLIGGQALAVTGLSLGESKPAGRLMLVDALMVIDSIALVIYLIALAFMGVGGLLLLCDLFKSQPSVGPSETKAKETAARGGETAER